MNQAADPESRVHRAHHDALRVWLRLFTCTQLIERTIRTRLRNEFNTTLPRFDLMAQLQRHPGGLKMGELSKRLLVTGGNVTAITDLLVAEGLVERAPIAGDRRAFANRGALYELLGHLKETLRETPQRKLRLMRASRENAR